MDIRKVKKLIEMLEESGVSEIEIREGEETVRISRQMTPPMPVNYTHMVNSENSYPHYSIPSPPSTPEASVNVPTTNEYMIPAPMVGTFYRAPGPNDMPFVDVGSKVKVGDVLCIVEAMKMLNQIEADREGIIKRVLIENGQPVEFGQALFILSDK